MDRLKPCIMQGFTISKRKKLHSPSRKNTASNIGKSINKCILVPYYMQKHSTNPSMSQSLSVDRN